MTRKLLIEEDEAPTKPKQTNRSIHLSATFVDGYAADWVMAVPACFHSALDIELTPRMEKDPETGKKRQIMKWTEGVPPIYNFARGDTLCNTKSVYDRAWGDALADISVSLQVVDAAPDQLMGKNSKIAGWVVVQEFRPRPDRSGVDPIKNHRLTQDEFVRLLKTGLFPDGTRL